MLGFTRRHWLTLGAGVLAAILLLTGRVTPRGAARAIDVDLLLILFALLTTIEILRASGYLDLAVDSTLIRFRTTRGFSLALVLTSGVVASLVTNDVTLFIVIPFTIIASRSSDFDVEDAVILEIVATNLIGCLTPLGNPQNLFVFHRSGWSAAHFIFVMLPFVVWSMAGLLAALFLLGRSRPMVIAQARVPEPHKPAAIAGAICFVLVLLEIARVANAWPAAVGALIAGAIFLRRRIFSIDYSIVPLFFFAFIVVEGLRSMNIYRESSNLFLTAIGLSQVISNVPATILLSPIAVDRWRELLYGVSAGGCGTIIASLANLLGWRIYVRESTQILSGEAREGSAANLRDGSFASLRIGFFWRLTAINFAFLAWVTIGGWLLLTASSDRVHRETHRPASSSASMPR